MLKILLVVLASCSSPSECTQSDITGAIFEYPRLVDCVRAKAALTLEAYCVGKPFDPREADLG